MDMSVSKLQELVMDGESGMLQSMELQSVRHDWAAELNWTGKFGLVLQNTAGQKLTEFCQENSLVIANTTSNNTREDFTDGHHQIVYTEIKLIIFFAAKNEEALYRQQKQNWELIVAQIMKSLLQNSDLN